MLGVDASKLTVIYGSASARDTAEIRYDPHFLTVATRQPAKNLPGVIRAFSLFSKRYDTANHRLIVVGGSGWACSGDADLIRELGMEKKIEFAGYVTDEELDRLYSTCKGHILLSFYEGFGMPILEALCWEKPSRGVEYLVDARGPGNDRDRRWIRATRNKPPLAIKAIAENPRQIPFNGADEQLEKFSLAGQVDAFLRVLGIAILEKLGRFSHSSGAQRPPALQALVVE